MTDHQAHYDALAARRGMYHGRGTDTEGKMFAAELQLSDGAGGRNLRYRYRAVEWQGNDVLHDEDGLLGIGLDGTLTLFAASSQYRHMFPRLLRRVEALTGDGPGEVAGSRLVFGHHAPTQRDAFRDEIGLALLVEDQLGYSFAWGLPGGELALRASVVMKSVARLADERPLCVRHWSALCGADDSHYAGDDELMAIGAAVGEKLGLTRIGVHVDTLLSGRRSSYPHAESAEEELVVVMSGHPHVWLDGVMWPLRPGDVVSFPAGTGQCHTFINNDREEARLVVIGEKLPKTNKVYYPLNDVRMAQLGERAWTDAPKRPTGDHDGLPDAVRARRQRPS